MKLFTYLLLVLTFWSVIEDASPVRCARLSVTPLHETPLQDTEDDCLPAERSQLRAGLWGSKQVPRVTQHSLPGNYAALRGISLTERQRTAPFSPRPLVIFMSWQL